MTAASRWMLRDKDTEQRSTLRGVSSGDRFRWFLVELCASGAQRGPLLKRLPRRSTRRARQKKLFHFVIGQFKAMPLVGRASCSSPPVANRDDRKQGGLLLCLGEADCGGEEGSFQGKGKEGGCSQAQGHKRRASCPVVGSFQSSALTCWTDRPPQETRCAGGSFLGVLARTHSSPPAVLFGSIAKRAGSTSEKAGSANSPSVKVF